MQTSIREIPSALQDYNFDNDYVMIHNLSSPVERTTQKQKIKDIVEKLSPSSKIKKIDLEEGRSLYNVVFEVERNEIVLINVRVTSNTANSDGYELYLFVKEGVGKFKGSGVDEEVEGEILEEKDFVLIDSSTYTRNVMVSDLNDDITNFPNQEGFYNLTDLLKTLLTQSLTKYDQPIINLTWGEDEKAIPIIRDNLPRLLDGTENVRNNIIESSKMSLLSVELSYWDDYKKFLEKGGSINLLIYKRKGPRKNNYNDNKQKLGHRWSLNKKSTLYGGAQIIPISQKQDWYDIKPEFLLKEGLANPNSYLDKKCNIKREKLGFALRFQLGSEIKETSILEELDLIMFSVGEGERSRLITFRKK